MAAAAESTRRTGWVDVAHALFAAWCLALGLDLGISLGFGYALRSEIARLVAADALFLLLPVAAVYVLLYLASLLARGIALPRQAPIASCLLAASMLSPGFYPPCPYLRWSHLQS